MEEKKEPRKYQRREFIKAGAKVGAGAALGGLIGYLPGRAYKEGKDAYRENVKPYVEKGKEIIDKTISPAIEGLEETKERLGNWWDKYVRKKQEEPEIENKAKEPKKISRRGFFSKYLPLFHEHPVATGTVTGAALGGLAESVKIYPKYRQKKNIANLKDKINNLEETSEEKDKEIAGLKYKIEKIYEKLNMSEKDSSGLENKLEEDNLKTTLSMLLSGIGLIIAFLLINGIDYTGFSVLSQDTISTSNVLGVIIIFTSLALIIIGGLRLRKIRKTKHF
ncbi:MAG: hypothetical protein NTZ83_05450 [Candidatus Pacearchaeota archaeon]|nr:hypothetical protein [Candidatus Pacearchaeota archaeon]